MVDRVAVQHDQLHRPAQLEDPFNLGLDLGQVVGPRAGLLEDGPLGRIVQYRLFAEGNVRGDARNDDPSLEFVLEKLEDSLLHHVRDLVALEGGADQDQGPNTRHDVVRRQGLLLLAQQPLLLFDDGRGGNLNAGAFSAVEVSVYTVGRRSTTSKARVKTLNVACTEGW